MMAQVYRFYSEEGELLYIGSANSTLRRFNEHGSRSEWWTQVQTITVEHHPTLGEAVSAEALAILNERPRYNEQYNHRTPRPSAQTRPRSPENADLPANLYTSVKGGATYYRHRCPITGRFKGLGTNREKACQVAEALNDARTETADSQAK